MVMECDCVGGGGHFLKFQPLIGCTVRVGVGQFYRTLLQFTGFWMDYCVDWCVIYVLGRVVILGVSK